MKLTTFWFLGVWGILLTSALSAKPIFDFRISKSHGLLSLLDALSDIDHAQRGLKNQFLAQHALNAFEASALENYKNLAVSLRSKEVSPGCSRAQQVLRLSIQHSDLSSLFEALKPKLSANELQTISTALKAFDTPYTQHLWKAFSKSAGLYRSQLLTLLERTPQHLTWAHAIGVFLGHRHTHLNDATLVGIFGLPESGVGHPASMGCNTIFLGIQTDHPDSAYRIALLFHELTHAFHQELSPARQAELRRWIYEHPMPQAHVLPPYLFEILATSVGQGFVMQELPHSGVESPWYADTLIDHVAKKALPLTRRYLRQKRPMDVAYIKALGQIIALAFPRAHLDPKIAWRELAFVIDGKSLSHQETTTHVRQALKPHFLTGYSPMSHPQIEKELHIQTAPLLILVTSDTGQEYAQLMKRLGLDPALTVKGSRAHLEKHQKVAGRSVYTLWLPDRKHLASALKAVANLHTLETSPL